MAAVLDKSGAWSLGESVLWYNPTAGGIDSTWSLGESIILDEVYRDAFSGTSCKVGGAWKSITGIWVKVGGAWKLSTGIYVKAGGAWKLA